MNTHPARPTPARVSTRALLSSSQRCHLVDQHQRPCSLVCPQAPSQPLRHPPPPHPALPFLEILALPCPPTAAHTPLPPPPPRHQSPPNAAPQKRAQRDAQAGLHHSHRPFLAAAAVCLKPLALGCATEQARRRRGCCACWLKCGGRKKSAARMN
jgi:hypothetical protein